MFTTEMLHNMKNQDIVTKTFDTKKSISRAENARLAVPTWKLISEGKEYSWTSKLERVNIIRAGIPYESIDGISKRINLPIKEV
jgi:hypothetical protein